MTIQQWRITIWKRSVVDWDGQKVGKSEPGLGKSAARGERVTGGERARLQTGRDQEHVVWTPDCMALDCHLKGEKKKPFNYRLQIIWLSDK